MKIRVGFLVLLSLAGLQGIANANDRVFPVRLVIPARQGGITFLHFLHAQRVKFECNVCHASTFQQNAEAPLGFKPGGHQAAVEQKKSCASCHREGEGAFTALGGCTSRCHASYAGDTGRPTQSGDTGRPTHSGE